jgi:hypothetical protein
MKLNRAFTAAMVWLVLFCAGQAVAVSYPESTDLMGQLAARVIAQMEKKAQWRYVPTDAATLTYDDLKKGSRYRKIPWEPGDRQPVAVYLFREEGTGRQLSFGVKFEKQLGLAMDGSSKFDVVVRDLQKFEEMKFRETNAMIDEDTAAALGNVLGARYFLTGTYWREGSETFIKLF